MCLSWRCLLLIMNAKHRKFSLDSSVGLDGGGLLGVRRASGRFGGKKLRQSQTLDEARLEIQELNHSLNSNISLRDQTISEEALNQSDGLSRNQSFQKHNKSFHKLFHEIPEDENLTHSFTCALQKEVLYHGRLFISENHVCFHSSVLLKDTKVVIAVTSVKEVKRPNSALSMLSIQTTDGEKYSFVSLRGREICFKILQRVCSHVQGWSANSSPHVSSAENEADQMSSYSSLEDCPNHDSSSGIPYLSSEGLTTHNSTRQNSISFEDNEGVSWIWRVTERLTPFVFREIKPLSILFYIYLILLVVLLLMSGYVGLRIIALEEQLNSLGAMTGYFSQQKQYQET